MTNYNEKKLYLNKSKIQWAKYDDKFQWEQEDLTESDLCFIYATLFSYNDNNPYDYLKQQSIHDVSCKQVDLTNHYLFECQKNLRWVLASLQKRMFVRLSIHWSIRQ